MANGLYNRQLYKHYFYKQNESSSLTSGFLAILVLTLVSCVPQQATETEQTRERVDHQDRAAVEHEDRSRLHILFLGDDGHHQPGERIQQVTPYLAERGIYIHIPTARRI